MNGRAAFNPLQAQEVAQAFAAAVVDYLFIGKGRAILLGFPGTTQDADMFPAKDAENGRHLVTAFRQLRFAIDDASARDIIAGKDFIQLTDGPFDLNIVFTPDGVDDYAAAKRRAVTERILPVANIRDIIASKKASNRKRSGTGAGFRGTGSRPRFLGRHFLLTRRPFPSGRSSSRA